MRKMFLYRLGINKSTNHPILNSFNELKIKKGDLSLFNYNYFKKTVYFEIFKFLNKNLFGRVISIGCGKGFLEYHLIKNKKNIIATDINKSFIKFNKKIKIKYLNILSKRNINFKKFGKFDMIYLPGIIYLFNDSEVKLMFKNLKKISKKNTKIIIFFRSRYSLLVSFFENFIVPSELYIKKFIFKFRSNEKVYKSFKGYRRTLSEMKNLIYQSKFTIDSFELLDYETEYNRSIFIKKFKLSKLLSYLFLKQHPYLNIFVLRNTNNGK
tara:strand:- start:3425 stop:4228 length:804 start_codon:yes stop_codon:yes gene_type:complete